MSVIADTPLNNDITQQVANRGTQFPSYMRLILLPGDPGIIVSKSGSTIRSPKPLPLGYLLHYPINILIHICWLVSRGNAPTLRILSLVSKLFHEVCKPLMPRAFTFSRSTYITDIMGLGSGGTETLEAEIYRQLVSLPDMRCIQQLRDGYPSKSTARAERFLYGRPYTSPRPDADREMCDQETQVEAGDREVPSWARNQYIVRRPRPPPSGYMLGYPIDLLTRIFGLACIDDAAAGRSLCLVGKDFHAAVKPVMLYRVQLKKLSQVLWLARLVSVDVAARVGIRRLAIDIPRLDKTVWDEERDWDERDSLFHWDSSYWGDPDAGYTYESDSSDYSEDSYDDSEETDDKQDVAFFATPEGQLRRNLAYGPDGELTDEGVKWPLDVGLDKARSLVNDAISNILRTVAPVLRNSEFISMDQRLGVTLPIFPVLSELTIHITLLPLLAGRTHVLFPALKSLHIQGKLGKYTITIDHLIHHAPFITEMRVPFDRDFLRALIGKLGTPPPPGALPKEGQDREFECVEKVYVAHDRYDKTHGVFKPDEPLFAKWTSVVHLKLRANGEDQ